MNLVAISLLPKLLALGSLVIFLLVMAYFIFRPKIDPRKHH